MLTLVGFNHRSAPLDLRERLALPASGVSAAIERLHHQPGVREAFILSTCNRMELLVRGAAKEVGASIEDYLEKQYGLDQSTVDRHSYRMTGRDAIRHLFRVTSGLDSMILGEPQIHGQVKDAFGVSRQAGATGVVLDRLLQHALFAAKRARSETGISRHAVSVASAAVSLASKIFGKLEGRRVLMLGAGKMGELVAQHLQRHGIAELVVCSRTFANADRAARGFGGRALHWDDGLDQLGTVDIVIGCTGAPQPVLTRKRVAKVLRSRRKGPLFLIDIAVPRDIDPAIHKLDNVYLYDIDALEGVVEGNMEERERAAELAARLIESEVDAFDRWRQSQGVAPLIGALHQTWQATGEHELERFRKKLGPLNEKQEKALHEMTRALTKKFLDRPTRYLRDSVDRGDSKRVAALFLEMFDLKPGVSKIDDDDDEELPKSGPQRLVKGGRDDS